MKKPLLMGIVNVTPDSFSDGGRYFNPESAIEQGLKLIRDGADILDIGGESTRPGAEPVSIKEETLRVVPVIRELARHGKVISIDTRHTEVMQAAFEAGAGFINDIFALQDKGALELSAKANVPVCLMHMQGEPQTMQQDPSYEDLIIDVYKFIDERINACLDTGILRENIYIDPGIGFGKALEHNIQLLQHLDKFHELGVKILLGVSRKKFIENIAGPAHADERLGGSIAAALWGVDNGVDILRVHDVQETRQAIEIWQALHLVNNGQ